MKNNYLLHKSLFIVIKIITLLAKYAQHNVPTTYNASDKSDQAWPKLNVPNKIK